MKKHAILWLIVSIGLMGCEVPKKPNFKTNHKVEAPLIYNKTFQFMGGGSNALIDTTSSDMDSLFTVDGDNFITISKEQDLDFGDLNDAIPVIDVEPTDFESEVGELELTNFSSEGDGNLGEAGFEDLTGIDPNTVDAGDPVPNQPAGTREVTIDLETDLFESATFKNGDLDVTLRNDLGFNLDDITIVLVSDPDGQPDNGDEYDLDNTNTGTVNDGETVTTTFNFDNCETNPDPNNCRLFNPSVRVSISWTGTTQNFQREPQSLVVEDSRGNQLFASQVQAALEEQDFNTNNVTTFESEDFEFTDPSHYVELKTGYINIDEIVNEMEFDIESMVMTFPDIQNCQNPTINDNPIVTATDPLQISYINAKRIPRAFGTTNPGIAPAEQVNIAGCFLYAEGNEVDYDIEGLTENTQDAPQGERIRLVREEHAISSSVDITDITIQEAFGIVKRQVELLNDDEGEDGILDLYNDNEADITEIDGLADFSNQLDGIEFTNPTMTISYFSNIGLPTTIYGAFVGTDSKGEEVYLLPESNEFETQPPDPTDGLQANGSNLDQQKRVIKFDLEEINEPNGRLGSPIVFTRENSNVDEFLNNLPSKIRFVGKSVINQEEGEATILDTLMFDPTISIDIPLAFQADQATFSDTTDADLGNIPSSENGDKSTLSSGILRVKYVNGLPLSVSVNLTLMDKDYQEVTTINGEESIQLTAASVGEPPNNVVTTPFEGSTAISLNEEQLRQLYKTEYIRVGFDLNTTDTEAVKIKTTDFVTLSVEAELEIDSDVELN